ncbi:MAG: hypothetical protein ACI4QL_04235, partial [Candidatus Fimimonas sp.]
IVRALKTRNLQKSITHAPSPAHRGSSLPEGALFVARFCLLNVRWVALAGGSGVGGNSEKASLREGGGPQGGGRSLRDTVVQMIISQKKTFFSLNRCDHRSPFFAHCKLFLFRLCVERFFPTNIPNFSSAISLWVEYFFAVGAKCILKGKHKIFGKYIVYNKASCFVAVFACSPKTHKENLQNDNKTW